MFIDFNDQTKKITEITEFVNWLLNKSYESYKRNREYKCGYGQRVFPENDQE